MSKHLPGSKISTAEVMELTQDVRCSVIGSGIIFLPMIVAVTIHLQNGRHRGKRVARSSRKRC